MCMPAYQFGGPRGHCPLMCREDGLFRAEPEHSQGWSRAEATWMALPCFYPTLGHKEHLLWWFVPLQLVTYTAGDCAWLLDTGSASLSLLRCRSQHRFCKVQRLLSHQLLWTCWLLNSYHYLLTSLSLFFSLPFTTFFATVLLIQVPTHMEVT